MSGCQRLAQSLQSTWVQKVSLDGTLKPALIVSFCTLLKFDQDLAFTLGLTPMLVNQLFEAFSDAACVESRAACLGSLQKLLRNAMKIQFDLPHIGYELFQTIMLGLVAQGLTGRSFAWVTASMVPTADCFSAGLRWLKSNCCSRRQADAPLPQ